MEDVLIRGDTLTPGSSHWLRHDPKGARQTQRCGNRGALLQPLDFPRQNLHKRLRIE